VIEVDCYSLIAPAAECTFVMEAFVASAQG